MFPTIIIYDAIYIQYTSNITIIRPLNLHYDTLYVVASKQSLPFLCKMSSEKKVLLDAILCIALNLCNFH